MPTYRYRCGGCGEEFEVWQSITDDPFRTHDHGCGGELVKVLTPAGIVLKGSGFYRNDSRSGAGKSSGDRADGEKSEKSAAAKDGKDGKDGKDRKDRKDRKDGSTSSSGGDTSSSGSSTANSTTS